MSRYWWRRRRVTCRRQPPRQGRRVPGDRDSRLPAADDYAGVVLPGGVANPDQLRIDEARSRSSASGRRAGKPMAAICHGPWTLVEADAVRGKTLTAGPACRPTSATRAATWRDEEVFRCDGGYTLVTSRKPDDLDAFTRAVVELFG